jgi:hypothetical protein
MPGPVRPMPAARARPPPAVPPLAAAGKRAAAAFPAAAALPAAAGMRPAGGSRRAAGALVTADPGRERAHRGQYLEAPRGTGQRKRQGPRQSWKPGSAHQVRRRPANRSPREGRRGQVRARVPLGRRPPVDRERATPPRAGRSWPGAGRWPARPPPVTRRRRWPAGPARPAATPARRQPSRLSRPMAPSGTRTTALRDSAPATR